MSAMLATMVGSITSSIGFGNTPSTRISSTSGAIATAPAGDVADLLHDGASGPVMVRWYMIRM